MATNVAKKESLLTRSQLLGPLTWYRVGGPAEWFAAPKTNDELVSILGDLNSRNLGFRVLGSGSNLLVLDRGVSGAVIATRSLNATMCEVHGTSLVVGAGYSLPRALVVAARAGLAGMEVLAGIPGTVGGAVAGNSGGRYGDIAQFVESVTVITSIGEERCLKREEVVFDYRKSNLESNIITSVKLGLRLDDHAAIRQRLRAYIKQKAASQPLGARSAGCIFRNPRGISAGELIRIAGLAGRTLGSARVSERHPNFFVVTPPAHGDDVLALIDQVRVIVTRSMHIDLELEIDVWG